MKGSIKNKSPEDIIKYAGAPHGEEEFFPNIKEMESHNLQRLAKDESLSRHERGEYSDNEHTCFVNVPRLQDDKM